jgi:hypothetical protein
MKRELGIIIGLIVTAAVAFACGSSADQEHSATVVEVENKVDAHPHPKDDWQPAEVEMAIYGGGRVRTGSASTARLDMLEGQVRLSSDTLFTVKESTTRQGELKTALSLQDGRVWVNLTTSQPHEFSVETSSAVAAVRDTRFSVEVGPDQTTLVSVAEGKVELTAQDKSVTVGSGEQALVEPGQPPSPPEPMSLEERGLWASEGETPSLAPPTPTAVPTLAPEPASGAGSMEWDTDRPGLDYDSFDLPQADPQLCQDACSDDERCKAWTYVKPDTTQGPNPRCWLKFEVPQPVKSDCCVSGVKAED